MKHTIRDELRGVIAFIGAIWGVFFVDRLLPVDLNAWGVTPRTLTGLAGILAMPFLHANLQHLISNTVPLCVLLILLAGSQSSSWEVVAALAVSSAALLWLVGRPATHIGASGLIFGLIAFLIVSGVRERRPLPLVVSLLVAVTYGGTLLSGLWPSMGSSVSWEGHLCGAIAGVLTAIVLTRGAPDVSRSE